MWVSFAIWMSLAVGCIIHDNCREWSNAWSSVAKSGSLLGLGLLLRSVCGTPKRARIDTIGIEVEHRVVELARSRRRLVQGNEIPDILPRLADNARIIRVFRYFVSGDHCNRIQGLELVERGNPFKPALPVGLAEKGMNSIVDRIAGSDQPDRRDMEAG